MSDFMNTKKIIVNVDKDLAVNFYHTENQLYWIKSQVVIQLG